MKTVFLVIRREYLSRVRKKSFIVLSLLAPLLFAGSLFVYFKLITAESTTVVNVKVVDPTGMAMDMLRSTDVLLFENIAAEPLDNLKKKYIDADATVLLVIDGNPGEYPAGCSFYSKNSVSMELSGHVRSAINRGVENLKMKALNVADIEEILAGIRTNVSVKTLKWDRETEIETNAGFIMLIAYIMATLVFMFTMTFGAMVMRGVVEEKTSRIVEVIISSVSPFRLMAGKIFGVGLVAFTQFLLWIALTFALVDVLKLFGGVSNPLAAAMLMLNSINFTEIICVFILFFFGGFLLYSSVFAAIGSSVDAEADTQQMVTPVMIPLILGFTMMTHTIRFPDSPLSFWASMIPLTSPIVMPARVAFGVPLWEIALSFALLCVTLAGMCYISAKIYRTGILMYGKKHSLKEMIKWIRYR
ncbi:MAG: ABC transporter permease [Prevotellaceae bacterium]|jgi:ABC-2 type transport system permease protein|nr:ABC transporter permease [Prevotellaceae bacterium]